MQNLPTNTNSNSNTQTNTPAQGAKMTKSTKQILPSTMALTMNFDLIVNRTMVRELCYDLHNLQLGAQWVQFLDMFGNTSSKAFTNAFLEVMASIFYDQSRGEDALSCWGWDAETHSPMVNLVKQQSQRPLGQINFGDALGMCIMFTSQLSSWFSKHIAGNEQMMNAYEAWYQDICEGVNPAGSKIFSFLD